MMRPGFSVLFDDMPTEMPEEGSVQASASAPVRGQSRGLIRLGRHLCRRLQAFVPARRPGITILAYHLVNAGTRSPVDLPLAVFRQQMDALQRSGRVIGLGRALRLLEGTAPLDRDRVVVTFDDAFENFDRFARPVLEELGVPATIFVPTGFLDGESGAPLVGAEDLPPMQWDRLRDLAHGGLMEVGSHSRSHRDLRKLPDRWVEAEVADSAGTIRDRTGVVPTVFCYPCGLWSPRVEDAVARHYRGAVVGGGRKSRPRETPLHRLQRVSVRNDMPASIEELVQPDLVLEEWVADRVRLWRGAGGEPPAGDGRRESPE